MAPLLELRGVSKIFGGGMFNRRNVTVAVDDISFTISEDNPAITSIYPVVDPTRALCVCRYLRTIPGVLNPNGLSSSRIECLDQPPPIRCVEHTVYDDRSGSQIPPERQLWEHVSQGAIHPRATPEHS